MSVPALMMVTEGRALAAGGALCAHTTGTKLRIRQATRPRYKRRIRALQEWAYCMPFSFANSLGATYPSRQRCRGVKSDGQENAQAVRRQPEAMQFQSGL